MQPEKAPVKIAAAAQPTSNLGLVIVVKIVQVFQPRVDSAAVDWFP